MAEDDGLLLNLSSYSDGQEIYPGKIDRKSKWKERKLQKRQRYLKANVSRENKQSNRNPLHTHLQHKDKASFHTPSIKPSKVSEVQEGSASSSVTENGAHPDGKQSRKKIQVISSLFNYNPEIPKLPASSIELPRGNKEQREKVFSGDKFSDLDLSAFMVSNLENNLKLTTMTSVQKAAIPSLLEGRDVFVKSKTGTGKTLTYAVPVIHSLQKIKPKISRNDGPYAVILVPTRELAIQSFDVLQKLVKPFQWVVPGIVTGGEKRKSEKARIRKGINVLVATPGRLLDHIEKTKSLELRRLRWIVLDEADRLLDLGFEKDVSSILTAVKKALFAGVRCQNVLLSATLSEGVQRLAGVSLHKPSFIDVTAETRGDEPVQAQSQSQSSNDVSYTTPEQLNQLFIVVPSKLRLVTLAAFLLWKNKSEESAAAKVIVFLSSRDSVDFHCSLFKECLRSQSKSQLMFFKLHGNMSQSERTDVFKKFSEAKTGILFCTDVAARGLDLPHVNWIIQYNTPGDPAGYVHRVGRTARIGLKGNALLFLTPAEVAYLETLKQHRISPQELLVNDVLKTLASSPNNSTGKKLKNVLDQKAQESATDLQNSFENYVLSDQHNLKAAKTAYQSFVRAYATYPSDLKHIFHIRNLHLGHVAKSFALREAPKEMFQAAKPHKTKRKRDGEKKISVKRRVTEYSSDTDLQGPLPKKRKKNKPR